MEKLYKAALCDSGRTAWSGCADCDLVSCLRRISPLDQKFNHGYLAVDFFFILSGFVVGYAYDDRWAGRRAGGGMRMRDFLKRRIVRLHPMVVLGSVLGAVTFLIQGSVQWDGTHVPFGMVMLAMLLGMFLIPSYPGAPYEVRGNNEMYPLNGPSWSLFFEYIGNILYALVLRRLHTRWPAVWWIPCLRMLPSSSRITTPITRLREDIISVRSTPTEDGTGPRPCLS